MFCGVLWTRVQPEVPVGGGPLRDRVRDLVPGPQVPYPGICPLSKKTFKCRRYSVSVPK